MANPLELAQQIEKFDDEQWYDFLDELDAVSRRRALRHAEPEPPPGIDRDALAGWIARKHFLADTSIREVWYLPTNAPADEIRLLEVNDRLAAPDLPQIKAIDFALDIQGCPFRLFVADITTDQLEQIKDGRLSLPPGWTLDKNTTWGRPGVTEHQRLFLVQARTDYAVFELLRKRPSLPVCHSLHYLQMATELFGKAHAWRNGPNFRSHRAFVGFLRSLTTNRQAQAHLGYAGQNANWMHRIRKSTPLAERIEDLAPALTPDGPNPEYPWPRDNPETAPAEHPFVIWQDLTQTADGRQFLELLGSLVASAETYL